MTTPNYIPMRCTACGAQLPTDFALASGNGHRQPASTCAYCGTTHTAHDATASPLGQQTLATMDKVAAELAIPRLEQELRALEDELYRVEQWLPDDAHTPFSRLAPWFLALTATMALVFVIGVNVEIGWVPVAASVGMAVSIVLWLFADRARLPVIAARKDAARSAIQGEYEAKRHDLARCYQAVR